MASEQGKGKLFGEGVPGTGGDFIDPNDTEGHRKFTDDEPGGLDSLKVRSQDDGRSSAKLSDDDDVEGHRKFTDDEPGGPAPVRALADDGDGRVRLKAIDDDDVEGHLYRSGPTTSGDFAKRAPSDNPHGES
jgi:hypothetical protein